MDRVEAVRQVIERFFRHIDDEEPEKVSMLFADDGLWRRRDQVFTGPAGVLRSLKEDPPLMPTCHLLTNFLHSEVSSEQAHAVFYITAYRSSSDPKSPRPLPMDVPIALALYKAVLALVDTRWRIKKIESDTIFRRG